MKILLNLATRTYINRRALFASYALAAAVLVILLGLNLSFLVGERAEIAEYKLRLAEIRKQFGGLSEGSEAEFTTADYRDLIADIRFANNILAKDGFRWTELLSHLEELLPEGAAVRGIRPDHKSGSLSITAVARGIDDMRLFLDQLMSSEMMYDIYLISQEKIEVKSFDGRPRNAVRFVVEIREAF